MGIYLVRPKSFLVSQSVSSVSRKLNPKSRDSQIKEVFQARLDNPVDQEIRRWVSDASTKGVKRISVGESHTKVTGMTVLDMSSQEAEQMSKELPDVVVMADQPIELIRPNKVSVSAQSSVSKKDLWHLDAIGLTKARRKKVVDRTGKGVTIAVLDTGIDPSHLEISGKVNEAYTFDVARWTANQINPSVDTDGHGTHVAGLICGNKVGVAPEARLLNGVMIPQGRGNISNFILALEWAATRADVQIVNMSAGIVGYHPAMKAAVDGLLSVGVFPVIATGNEKRNSSRSPGNYSQVLSVGASNKEGRVSSFSSSATIVADNHQYSVPDLVAPGESIYSCVVSGGYEAWDGTSMATPIVSGVAALILEKYPNISLPALEDEILLICKNLGQPRDRQGNGLVHINNVWFT